MGPVRLYLRYVGVSVRSQMQYRASFVMSAIGQFLLTGAEFLALWALFDRFGHVEGWSLAEVALLYGMANVSFAIADAFSRGFDVFYRQVKSGEFDRLLLRPRATALQVAASEVQLMRIGRLLQGGAVLVWALTALEIPWTPARLGLLLAALMGGACLFIGLFIVQGTLSFWTTEGLEVMNTLTYGGVETAQYPIAIYADGFRRFFTYVIPLACMNYFPMLAMTGHPDPLGSPAWVPWIAPLVGVAFLAACLRVWKIGVRHYTSTGS